MGGKVAHAKETLPKTFYCSRKSSEPHGTWLLHLKRPARPALSPPARPPACPPARLPTLHRQPPT
ncbi:hypothetical protein E2C01_099249 [Portunus trituberculatus]|uniref:Uncharacterized protein n=1 Tax=Portunus trituberculatus TaxID=210409 RepID=A0A5B7KAH3_PORTR|nr:hypothetical protein [Portunus trituberculatus]